MENRLSAALYLKNAVIKYWSPEDRDPTVSEKAFSEETQSYVKVNLGKLLLANQRKIGESLADMVDTIGKMQSLADWTGFIPVNIKLILIFSQEILTGLGTPTPDTHFVVLHTLKKLFKKFSLIFPLFSQIDTDTTLRLRKWSKKCFM